jgi:cadmium resistance protein CadD (predicted permease)
MINHVINRTHRCIKTITDELSALEAFVEAAKENKKRLAAWQGQWQSISMHIHLNYHLRFDYIPSQFIIYVGFNPSCSFGSLLAIAVSSL